MIQCLPGLSSASSIKSERSRGRPRKNFDESSDVVKHRKTKEVRVSKTSSELVYATTMKLREEGDIATAELLKESTSTTPTRSKKLLAKWKSPLKEQNSLTPEEALSLIISLSLSKNTYLTLRSVAFSHSYDIHISIISASVRN